MIHVNQNTLFGLSQVYRSGNAPTVMLEPSLPCTHCKNLTRKNTHLRLESARALKNLEEKLTKHDEEQSKTIGSLRYSEMLLREKLLKEESLVAHLRKQVALLIDEINNVKREQFEMSFDAGEST